MDAGSLPFKADAHLWIGIGPEQSKWTTCPEAWTPESVLPAAIALTGLIGSSSAIFSSKVPWTVFESFWFVVL